MGLGFVLALLAFVCAVIGGVMQRNNPPGVLVALAAVLLALLHLIGSGGL